MAKMIVHELVLTLMDMDQEAEVRIAYQPSYPLTAAIGDIVESEAGVVYLASGGDEQYGSREIFE